MELAPPPSTTSDTSGPRHRLRLRLYVAGTSPRSAWAVQNVRRLEGSALSGRYDLEVVDVEKEPERAEQDRVLATPTLLKLSPVPVRRIVGDLSDLDRLVAALGSSLPETTP